jgi:hypothetical protein
MLGVGWERKEREEELLCVNLGYVGNHDLPAKYGNYIMSIYFRGPSLMHVKCIHDLCGLLDYIPNYLIVLW